MITPGLMTFSCTSERSVPRNRFAMKFRTRPFGALLPKHFAKYGHGDFPAVLHGASYPRRRSKNSAFFPRALSPRRAVPSRGRSTAATNLLGPTHTRMPALLRPKDYDRWLGPNPAPRELLAPFPAEPMSMW